MDARYLRVKNWDRFQHYKNRENAPYWIKMYPDLLTNYEFLQLSEAERYKLMALWLLASRLRNRIPYDAKFVAKVIGSTRIDLDKFVAAGFLEVIAEDHLHVDAGIDPGIDVGRTQNRTEKEGEKEQNRTDAGLVDLESLAKTLSAREPAAFGSEERLFEVLTDMDKNSTKVLRPLLEQLPAASIEKCRAEVLAARDLRRPTGYAVEVLTSMIEARRAA